MMQGPKRAVHLKAWLKREKPFLVLEVVEAHHLSLIVNSLDLKLLIVTMMINQTRMKDPTRNHLEVESVQGLISGL